MVNARILRHDEALAVELTTILKRGDIGGLSELLAADPGLAGSIVADAKGGGRSPLHLFADWPGHNPNPRAVVQALVAHGADLNAPAVGMWHRETPLHWAASSDDVALADALLHAGADIEWPGSSINGGAALSSAVGYGQWAVARRLVERGARTLLWQEAALGLMERIAQRFDAAPHPGADEISGAFWNACHGGQFESAGYLLIRGADPNWPAPWSGQTPLDIAERSGRNDLAAWLVQNNAVRGVKS